MNRVKILKLYKDDRTLRSHTLNTVNILLFLFIIKIHLHTLKFGMTMLEDTLTPSNSLPDTETVWVLEAEIIPYEMNWKKWNSRGMNISKLRTALA